MTVITEARFDESQLTGPPASSRISAHVEIEYFVLRKQIVTHSG
jgi:hypothetical protein